MSYLSNKKILLTGAAGGFGSEFIRQLLKKSAHLILSDINEEVLTEKASLASGTPGKIISRIAADLSTPEGCERLYLEVKEKAGNIDIIIHNAGMLTYGYFHETPVDSFYKLMQVNTLAPMHISSLFLQDMVKQRNGHIVFLSSVAGFIPTSFETSYSVSKFAIRGFGMALFGELSKMGISVTNIYPFWADTNILNSPSFGRKRAKRVPSFLVDSSEKVVTAAVKGIENRKLHVYPGFFAKATWWISKLWPMIGRQPVQEDF
ncbi:MAG: SDR family NAD(P)-dependent oxidoreductase [Pseudomonadota bacterium]